MINNIYISRGMMYIIELKQNVKNCSGIFRCSSSIMILKLTTEERSFKFLG